MNTVIEAYYDQAPIHPFLLKQKIEKFSCHPDIQEEFAYWITNKAFAEEPVVVEGYTAEQLASLSEYLVGEGAFLLLIDLRENPEKALQQISKGFTML